MSRSPLVLGIAGSPRRHGNSDRLLEAALEGAEGAGARTEVLVASTSGVRPCLGCNACSLTGECVLNDGASLYRAIDAADALIVASPVFFATVPAVLKTVIDRMQPYWARTHVLGQEPPRRRPGAVLLARSGGDPFGFDAADATIRSVFAVLGVDVVAEVRVEGVDRPADLSVRPDALEQAHAAGRQVAEATVQRRAASGDRSSS